MTLTSSSRTACSAPSTSLAGAKSPPMASTAIVSILYALYSGIRCCSVISLLLLRRRRDHDKSRISDRLDEIGGLRHTAGKGSRMERLKSHAPGDSRCAILNVSVSDSALFLITPSIQLQFPERVPAR